MINLLPEKEKQELFLGKKEKLATIFGLSILIILICLILILLSIKFYLLTEVDIQKEKLKEIESQKDISGFEEHLSIIKNQNDFLEQIDILYSDQIYFYNILNVVLNIPKPENLNFTSFALNRPDNNTINVSVSGTSASRDDLLLFKKNIEEVEEVKNLAFSSASWISPKDVKFSLTFQIYKNEQQ